MTADLYLRVDDDDAIYQCRDCGALLKTKGSCLHCLDRN